ncbi:LOW QUALITY PROTEIN: olfactory receptor 14A16-like [Sceloporus undulatus]|uniref:LOW QUALITY PROTEIN: olfactory receptor 14A16-like n=1 Tax=Sceloporus undulatus TaxID=8520 RepID=UPI001C4D3263|nr:LOW QUALITY PROTEIN: olfactory receptor 14A16-like [Sceloporus undulatus]
MRNATSITSFLLLGFSDTQEQNIMYFTLLLVIYLAVLMANFLIISAVFLDHRLHTPMYFFLVNLSIVDLGSISVTIPKAMINSLWNTRDISYSGCVAQVFSCFFFLISDLFLLTSMAYDRYVAICDPLHYETVMSRKVCIQLATSAWLAGLVYSALHTGSTFAITFCSNIIGQFFCEIPQLLKISCDDMYLVEVGVIVFSIFIVFPCFGFIVASYVQIFKSVLRIPTTQGRSKAFSTCLPHLIVVSLFISTGSIAYLKPISGSPSELDVVVTVLYSVVPPLMNPIIYTMRNQDIKVALWKMFQCGTPFWHQGSSSIVNLIYSLVRSSFKTCSSLS